MAYRVFKSSTLSCKYIFKDGSCGYFMNGRLTTDNPIHIAELEKEVELNHPTIYVDEKDSVAETAQLDPMADYKKRIIAEYEAARAQSSLHDVGNSTKEAGAGTGVGTTENTGVAAAKIVAGAVKK